MGNLNGFRTSKFEFNQFEFDNINVDIKNLEHKLIYEGKLRYYKKLESRVNRIISEYEINNILIDRFCSTPTHLFYAYNYEFDIEFFTKKLELLTDIQEVSLKIIYHPESQELKTKFSELEFELTSYFDDYDLLLSQPIIYTSVFISETTQNELFKAKQKRELLINKKIKSRKMDLRGHFRELINAFFKNLNDESDSKKFKATFNLYFFYNSLIRFHHAQHESVNQIDRQSITI